MAQLFLACSKCKQPMPVDEQMVKNAMVLEQELIAAHDVCPGEERPTDAPPALRLFRAQVVIAEIPAEDGADADVFCPAPVVDGHPLELICGAGKTVEAKGAAEAVNGALTNWMNEVWPTLQMNAQLADSMASTPTTES